MHRSAAPADARAEVRAILGAMITALIDSFGGLVSTAELYGYGFGRASIVRALDSGAMIRVRQGWYARPGLHPELLASARVGGRATCMTALRLLGVWVRTASGLHVAVPPHACQLRSAADSRHRLPTAERTRVHWDDRGGGSRLRVPPLDALLDLSRCEPVDWVVAAADSLLRVRPDLRHGWPHPAIFGERVATALRAADGICESGTETFFWLRMRDKVGFMLRQVEIAGVGRVDFLIGAHLVIEIDGAAYHTDPIAFERDRRRDALLSALGYRVLRFSYHQVMSEWPSVEAAVLAAVARLDHV